jgi:fumarylpyruvate hydrolase
MRYLFPPPSPPALAVVARDELFPVRRVYCVGRNYADHIVEMGGDPDREPPFFFQKNPDDLWTEARVPYPPATANMHHEAELAIALSKGGEDIAEADALACVWGAAPAIDLTRRDVQDEAKAMRRPWTAAKAFRASAPIGPLVKVEDPASLARGAIRLSVNGELRQNGDLGQMVWKIPEMIAALSRLFTLAPGDVILTGTPAGVGAVGRGDRIACSVEGVGAFEVEIA